MRTSRIVEEGAGYYHIVSRVVDRRRVFDDHEKERFRDLMRAVSEFSDVKILTWCCMENHIHLLMHVPECQEVGDAEFLRRLACLYDGVIVGQARAYLVTQRKEGHDKQAEEFKREYTYRMYDLGEFMKTLKQRLTMSYNKRHGRKGTLWEERFKSTLVEGTPGTLMRMAAYIDLNPVRAGLVKDPKDYRYSGYGEAMGGSQRARTGIMALMDEGVKREGWWSAAARYRQLLYVSGERRGVQENGRRVKPGFAPEVVTQVVDQKGTLPLTAILRCRIRYFTDGAILGSRMFVEGAFLRHRAHFGAKRETGARPMKGADYGDLFTARHLRVDVVSAPVPA